MCLDATTEYINLCSVGKESACNAGDPSSIPGLGISPGEGTGYPLQYSGLKNSMDGIVRGCKEWDTTEQLSVFTFRAAGNTLPTPVISPGFKFKDNLHL